MLLQTERATVMDVIEKATPTIIKRYLATITQKERVSSVSMYMYNQCVSMSHYFRLSSGFPTKASTYRGWPIARLVS